jgi:S-(hydroxymethyl)glutathione dehydrogenase/alcohol dehydrogenase
MIVMRAAVLFESPGELRIEDVEVAAPGRREVLVRVAATGLCHSDMRHLRESTYLTLPMVPGHEASGVVEAVGSDVTYLAKGDHVVASSRAFCGQCEFCLSGRPTLCAQAGLRRAAGEPSRLVLADGRGCSQLGGLGTFAELMLVHENTLVKIDRDIPLDRAALLGCAVVTGVGAVIRTARIHAGANIAVVGCGGIGLNCIQGAVIAGANRIVAIDINDDKLDLAKRFGATDVINSTAADVPAQLEEILPGQGGVDYAFEALGRRETCELSFALLRPGGTATIIGTLHGSFEVPGMPLLQERKIQGSMFGSVDFRRDAAYLLDLYRAGRLKLDELISQRLTLDTINDGFAALARGGVARSLIVFP